MGRILVPHLGMIAAAAPRVDALLGAIGAAWESAEPAVLDFSTCRFVSPIGIGILVLLQQERDRLGRVTQVDWDTVGDAVARQLARWQFSALFGRQASLWTDNAVPILQQRRKDMDQLVAFVDESLGRVLSMNASLAKATRNSFCEVFHNVFQHAESAIGGIALGQVFPNAKRFVLCVADCGIGLVKRVQRSRGELADPGAAIEWALGRGNSTRSGPEPPGLGLFLLREFIRVNEGAFRIFANQACFTERRGDPHMAAMGNELPGTLIEMRFNVRDDVTYVLEDDA